MDYDQARRAPPTCIHFRGPFLPSSEDGWRDIGGQYLTPGGEWNPVFWQEERDLIWYAYQQGSYVEKVVVDTWGCKFSQNGEPYVPWSEEAIQACGRSWHPEHERYVRKVVEELGCFGNVVWALDNEGQNIGGWQANWFRKMRDVIRDEEQKSGCGFVHLIGTSVEDVRGEVDYSITHDRTPLLSPIEGHWTLDNEHNPELSADEEEQNFAAARRAGLAWALWRAGMDDVTFEDVLARFKRVVEGGGSPPPPIGKCVCGPVPLDKLHVNIKPHGQGFDATFRCTDQAYCECATGISGVTDCALGVEGTDQRRACEAEAYGAPCMIIQETATGSDWLRCLPDGENPDSDGLFCDHFEMWQEGTPYTGICQRNADGNPIAGTPWIGHGKGWMRACNAAGTICSGSSFVDHAVP